MQAHSVWRIMSVLHALLANLARRGRRNQVGQPCVLSSLKGGILVVPDSCGNYMHEAIDTLVHEVLAWSLRVVIGVARGDLEVLEDADRRMNFFGPAINVAARLAQSPVNTGCLFHSSYREFIAASAHRAEPHLQFGTELTVTGKAHDSPLECWTAVGYTAPVSADEAALPQPSDALEETVGAVLAFDLPHFSAGDRSTVSSRLRSLVSAIDQLRAEYGRAAPLVFAPGGDGGVVLLPEGRKHAFRLAEELVELLEVESDKKVQSAQVQSRVGLHYGPVSLYRDGEGVQRPTGPVCFAADELAKDVDAGSGVVVSEEFRDVVTDGNRNRFEAAYTQLPALTDGPAKGIGRFQKSHETHRVSGPRDLMRIADAKRQADALLKVLQRHSLIVEEPERNDVERFFFRRSGEGRVPVSFHWRNFGAHLHWVDYCLLALLGDLRSGGLEPRPLVTLVQPEGQHQENLRKWVLAIAGVEPVWYHEMVPRQHEFADRARTMGLDESLAQRIMSSEHARGLFLGSRIVLDWFYYLVSAADSGRRLVILAWERHRHIFAHLRSVLPLHVLLLYTKNLYIGGQLAKLESPGRELILDPPAFDAIDTWLLTADVKDIDSLSQHLGQANAAFGSSASPLPWLPHWRSAAVGSGDSAEGPRAQVLASLRQECARIGALVSSQRQTRL